MAPTRRALLLVEDEDAIAEPLVAALTREGFAPRRAATIAEAARALEDDPPELVLLDVMLPDGSGLDLLRDLRQRSTLPVILLTALDGETDRVVGLELGADDYVAKPFSARELAARVRAVLRRGQPASAEHGDGSSLSVGAVTLDRDARIVRLGGDVVDLSRREYELFEYLLTHAGRVVRRETLLAEVWDTTWFGSTKTLDVHVSSLRRKLGDDASDPQLIRTVRGVGFLVPADEGGAGA